MPESMEVKIARIDENVKHIKKEIKCFKEDCDNRMHKHDKAITNHEAKNDERFGDHEDRIRDNEKFKQRGYGAIGIISALIGIIVIVVGWIVVT